MDRQPTSRSSRFRADGELLLCRAMSLPFERTLLPFIDEADSEHSQENHHGPEGEYAGLAERDGPWKEEGDFKIENDEQDGDKIEPHIELQARVAERVEATLVGGEFLW